MADFTSKAGRSGGEFLWLLWCDDECGHFRFELIFRVQTNEQEA
jgi:hypothetical protein